MEDSSIFDELAAELSIQERRELLDRIAASAQFSAEPLFKAPPVRYAGENVDYTTKASSLAFFARILLALRSLFSGKSKETLLREDDLRQIARRIEARYPLLLDRRRSVLLSGLADELRRLRDAARYFYDILDRSVERDKSAFFAFLASIELPELHKRLVADTDPYSAAKAEANETELRSALHAIVESAIAEMDETGRRAMYRDLRSVIFLKRLSGFLFERLLGAFKPGLGSGGAEGAPCAEVRDLFLELGDILRSMSEPPSAALMEALFVFIEREEIAKPEAESILTADIARAGTALGRIRAFNERVPMAELSRVVSGDPAYQPRDLAGGEDWLAIYKAFWRERIDARIDEWKADRRSRQLAEEIATFVGKPGPTAFANISGRESDAAPAMRYESALTFLDAFVRGVYQRELLRPLKLILVDGEFYRKDNRLEYTDAFDCLSRLPDSISALDARLGPQGEIGAAWAHARGEISPSVVKHRKLQTISREAEDEAERLVRDAAESLAAMVKLLGGIMKGEAGGRYDSLSNLSSMDGKSNKEFLKSLSAAKARCESALAFVGELSGLDFGRSA
jgi:hypothetical protein